MARERFKVNSPFFCRLVPKLTDLLRKLLWAEEEEANEDSLSQMGKWTQQRVANVVFVLHVRRFHDRQTGPFYSRLFAASSRPTISQ